MSNTSELRSTQEQKEITSSEFIKQSGLKKASFYNLMAEYRKILETNKKYKEKSEENRQKIRNAVKNYRTKQVGKESVQKAIKKYQSQPIGKAKVQKAIKKYQSQPVGKANIKKAIKNKLPRWGISKKLIAIE